MCRRDIQNPASMTDEDPHQTYLIASLKSAYHSAKIDAKKGFCCNDVEADSFYVLDYAQISYMQDLLIKTRDRDPKITQSEGGCQNTKPQCPSGYGGCAYTRNVHRTTRQGKADLQT